MNSYQDNRTIFVAFNAHDNTEFAGFPLFVDILVDVKPESFTINSNQIPHLEHLRPNRLIATEE